MSDEQKEAKFLGKRPSFWIMLTAFVAFIILKRRDYEDDD